MVYKIKLCVRTQPLSKTKEKTYYYLKDILGTEFKIQLYARVVSPNRAPTVVAFHLRLNVLSN